MISGLGATFTYDEANRIASAIETSGGVEYYGYAPDNKQIYTQPASGPAYWTLYGVRGEKLGTYTISPIEYASSPVTFSFVPYSPNVWFAGKLISKGGASGTFRDRLGTDRATGARFRPFGDEITSTGNDFATYTNDSYTGLGYADQRFYASTYGRFNTPDPYQASGRGTNNPGDPGSWNRYAYVEGDPINNYDPRGLDAEDPEDDDSSNAGAYWGYPFYYLASPGIQFLQAYNTLMFQTKGGSQTIPNKAARTAWQYLNNNWSNCLSDFEQSANFNAAKFQQLLNGGITWVGDQNGALNNFSINTVAHNGNQNTIGSLFSGGADAATIPGTNVVILGPDYYTNETQTQQVAVMIHEALHVLALISTIIAHVGLAGELSGSRHQHFQQWRYHQLDCLHQEPDGYQRRLQQSLMPVT